MMNLNFKDKTAVVTGSSRGIGKSIAQKLLKLDAKVIITGTGGCPDWINEHPQAIYKKLDFLISETVEIFTKELEQYPKIDILINNAGIHIPQPIDTMDKNNWDKILKINLSGPMTLMKAISSNMKKNKSGRILNISSIAGVVSKPGSGAYSASKAGLIGLTRATALDLAASNVLVNALCPGTTRTDMLNSLLSEEQKKAFIKNIPLGRFARPEEISNVAVFLCSEMNTYITGQTIVVDGGSTAR